MICAYIYFSYLNLSSKSLVFYLQEGYHLKKLRGYSFSCQKFSEIVVHIFAGEGVEESLASILLSLSG